MTARVSRRDLAHNRWVWLATGGTGVGLVVLTIGMALFEEGARQGGMLAFSVVYGIFALYLLRRQPPDIGEPFNHVVLLYVSSATVAGVLIYQPGAGAALGPGMFIGPLIAMRLQDRRLIALHLLVAAVGLVAAALGGAAFGIVDATSVVCVLVMVPAMWVLAASCTVILEASEDQGEELERLVRRDPLTGVGNRRLLDERLAEELRRHGRSGQQLSLIALDLNGFKALNDTLGHDAGDELLRDTAMALVRAVGPQDTVVRQGGDEFCVLLPQTSPAHARRTANAIRANLAGTDTGGLVSSGIGIATYPDDALQAHVLLHVADERLIADKAGRDRHVARAPVPLPPLPERRATDRPAPSTRGSGHPDPDDRR